MLRTAGHLCSESGWHGGGAKSICANCGVLMRSAETGPSCQHPWSVGLIFPSHILWIKVDHQNMRWLTCCHLNSVSWMAMALCRLILLIVLVQSTKRLVKQCCKIYNTDSNKSSRRDEWKCKFSEPSARDMKKTHACRVWGEIKWYNFPVQISTFQT